jgi:homoserine dehydrogenase
MITKMRNLSLALVGFGNVGKAFARLLLDKQKRLLQEFHLQIKVTGITTRSHGSAIDPAGIDLEAALSLIEQSQPLDQLSQFPLAGGVLDFIRACPADVLFENTPVNHHTGQPAVEYLRAGLEKGMHAVTANKGPVVHAYAELSALAAQKDRRFMFESAVMDGAPIFSLFRGSLPAVDLIGFRGILNSCTNLLLEQMEQGKTFDAAVRYAQSIGIAETDPAADIDGWDAAIKVAALSTVLMGIPLKPQQIEREGIRGITPQMIESACAAGQRWKLVCSAHRDGDRVKGRVAPERVGPGSPLFDVGGTSSFVQFELDVLPGLGILEKDPGPETTAYGLLADLLNIVRGM